MRLLTPVSETAPIISFGPIVRATFVSRPNRFLVSCVSAGHGLVEAFMPNPGRMWELLLPGVKLYLTDDAAPESPRKTRFTVLAVERDGAPIFLHTHANNAVARALLEQRRIPGLKTATVLRHEVRMGRSRFDFLLRQGGRDVLLEVKSCTLFGNRIAMFPDAITERGRKHLLELAETSEHGVKPVVLFLIHTPHIDWFMPDYHTDLAFSRTLLEVRDKVRILPVSIGWTKNLQLKGVPRRIDIPWHYIDREAQDRGGYLLILRLKSNKMIDVGQLGRIQFKVGYYLYAGSAMKNLTARLARHSRLRKRLHWHIDYLRAVADEVIQAPIRRSTPIENELVHALAQVYAPGPVGFGASDTTNKTHLFYSKESPLHQWPFHALLADFRMRGNWAQ